jgi:hypothetical protein
LVYNKPVPCGQPCLATRGVEAMDGECECTKEVF